VDLSTTASTILEIRADLLSEIALSEDGEADRNRQASSVLQEHSLLVAMERAVGIIQGLSSVHERKSVVAQTPGMIEFLLEICTCGPFAARTGAARALQQLAYTDEEAQFRMCELGAVKVLVGLVQCSCRQVRDEASRCFQWLGENPRCASFATLKAPPFLYVCAVLQELSFLHLPSWVQVVGQSGVLTLSQFGQSSTIDCSGALERLQHLKRSPWSTCSASCE
jgi:hypothetical protein